MEAFKIDTHGNRTIVNTMSPSTERVLDGLAEWLAPSMGDFMEILPCADVEPFSASYIRGLCSGTINAVEDCIGYNPSVNAFCGLLVEAFCD